MEGNATYVRDSGELASDVPTETMFELYDPQRNFSKANFSYTWDLGNGYGAVMFKIFSGLQCSPCFFFFLCLMQKSDQRDQAGCPLPLLGIGELHTAAETWSQYDRCC